MTRLILDKAAATRLRDVHERLALCDESGVILGYFTPAGEAVEYEDSIPPISEEELRRRLREDPTFTTAEVLDHLKKL
jgi:hypothetical protein